RCGHSKEYLREQWRNQVKAQTKPLPRQSRSAGKDAVSELLRLRESRNTFKQQERELNKILLDHTTEPDVHAETIQELAALRSNISNINLTISKRSDLLGVSDRTRLQKLVNNPFYAARVNAIAMKTRLRDRLRSRKFEMEHVERSFRKQVNDQKLDEHTASSVHRRDPTISRLASNYNRIVETMEELIKTRKAPSHAICPQKIDTKGLYALDVDDTIWQDSGLNDDDDSTAPPPWLANEKVREGIKAVLLYDRCLEERARLQHECRSMRIWFAEEWKVLNLAMDT
ncbi:hypothetical protein H0H92_011726, partial [Tricholoma furcatifolium]